KLHDCKGYSALTKHQAFDMLHDHLQKLEKKDTTPPSKVKPYSAAETETEINKTAALLNIHPTAADKPLMIPSPTHAPAADEADKCLQSSTKWVVRTPILPQVARNPALLLDASNPIPLHLPSPIHPSMQRRMKKAVLLMKKLSGMNQKNAKW